MTTLKLMMQATLVATLVYGSGVLAQTTETENKAPEDTATQPAPENKADVPADAKQAAEPENKAAEPADAQQAAQPEDKAAEPAAATAQPAEPATEAAQAASSAEVTPAQLAAAEAELTRVQTTKTWKDKWDVCEETSHWSPKDGANEAYKTQTDCMAGAK